MKRGLAILLTLMMALGAAFASADVAADIAAGQGMTHEELVEKAQAETGTFIVYGNTSRIETAAEAFSALYNIPVSSSNPKDQEIYTRLRAETGADAADMVMIQDGAQLTDARQGQAGSRGSAARPGASVYQQAFHL